MEDPELLAELGKFGDDDEVSGERRQDFNRGRRIEVLAPVDPLLARLWGFASDLSTTCKTTQRFDPHQHYAPAKARHAREVAERNGRWQSQ